MQPVAVEYLSSDGSETELRVRVADEDRMVARIPGCPSPSRRAVADGWHAILCSAESVALVAPDGTIARYAAPNADWDAELWFGRDRGLRLAITDPPGQAGLPWDGVILRLDPKGFVEASRTHDVVNDPDWYRRDDAWRSAWWRSASEIPGNTLPPGVQSQLAPFAPDDTIAWLGWRWRGRMAAWALLPGRPAAVGGPVMARAGGRWRPLIPEGWGFSLAETWIAFADGHLMLSREGADPRVFDLRTGVQVLALDGARLARLLPAHGNGI